MKLLILAAGQGTRLGQDLAKPLTTLVSGKSILETQIEAASKFFPHHDIHIVVGYQKEKIKELFPNCAFIENPDFATQNTAGSLRLALEEIGFEDVLWMNGDVVMKEGLLAHILAAGKSAVLVNEGPVGEEEVKYSLKDNGTLARIGKEIQGGLGEALGVNYMLREDVQLLLEALNNCDPMDYFEKGMDLCLESGMELTPIKVGRDDCIEIDFPQDLEAANRLIQQWSGQKTPL